MAIAPYRTVRWHYWNATKVIHMVMATSRQRLAEASEMVIEFIRSEMSQPKSGRRYGSHIASAEGEYPAIMTQDLYNALEYKITQEGNKLISKIGVNVDGDEYGYAIMLEIGTPTMTARPFLRYSIFANEDKIKAILGA